MRSAARWAQDRSPPPPAAPRVRLPTQRRRPAPEPTRPRRSRTAAAPLLPPHQLLLRPAAARAAAPARERAAAGPGQADEVQGPGQARWAVVARGVVACVVWRSIGVRGGRADWIRGGGGGEYGMRVVVAEPEAGRKEKGTKRLTGWERIRQGGEGV